MDIQAIVGPHITYQRDLWTNLEDYLVHDLICHIFTF